jgi:ESS family glutamate:Na+ symporter
MISVAVVLLLLVAGNAVAARSSLLRRLNIPGSFLAGAVGSVLLLVLGTFDLPTFTVSGPLRDVLLVLFFISAGLGTTITSWLSAGRPLLVLSVLCFLMMICQNVIGIGVATFLGVPAALGVLAGSIAFAGGLGSAVAWGSEFAAKGVQHATEVAVIAATVGMVVGTFVGGPYVSWVIRTRHLAPSRSTETAAADAPGRRDVVVPLIEKQLYVVFLLFALAGVGGDLLRDALRVYGIIVPRFLTAMLAGVLISVVADLVHRPLPRDLIERVGDICLSLFIVMALCGIDLRAVGQIAGPMALMAAAQTVGIVLFAHFLVFRPMGRNYESAVTAGGFIGYGLSSFAVAMATVKQVERNFGPAPQAVMLTTLVGGAVSNLANAIVAMAFYQWLFG